MSKPALWMIGIVSAIGAIVFVFSMVSVSFLSPTAALVSIGVGLAYALLAIVLLRITPLWPKMTWGKSLLWVLTSMLFGGGFSVVLVLAVADKVGDVITAVGWDEAAASWAGAYPEEPAKALGVLLILLCFRGLNRPWHGLVTGALVGLGFEVTENFTYAAILAPYNLVSDVEGSLQIWAARGLIGPFLHVSLTAIAGWGIGQALFRANKSTARRWGVALGWLSVSFALHFGWNYISDRLLIGATGLGWNLVIVMVIMYPTLIWLICRAWRPARDDDTYLYAARVATKLPSASEPRAPEYSSSTDTTIQNA